MPVARFTCGRSSSSLCGQLLREEGRQESLRFSGSRAEGRGVRSAPRGVLGERENRTGTDLLFLCLLIANPLQTAWQRYRGENKNALDGSSSIFAR